MCIYIYVYRNIFTISVRRNVLILGVDRRILGLFRGTLIRTALGSANQMQAVTDLIVVITSLSMFFVFHYFSLVHFFLTSRCSSLNRKEKMFEEAYRARDGRQPSITFLGQNGEKRSYAREIERLRVFEIANSFAARCAKKLYSSDRCKNNKKKKRN